MKNAWRGRRQLHCFRPAFLPGMVDILSDVCYRINLKMIRGMPYGGYKPHENEVSNG
jgi:hypothetical protein